MFEPKFSITPMIINALVRIEKIKQEIQSLPITAHLLASLRETARYVSTHYSTKIEGNRLTQREVVEVLKHGEHFPEKQRDEKEILRYYAALAYIEGLIKQKIPLSEQGTKYIHALVMSGGKKRVKQSPYRDGQNVIRDGYTIVYLPPEAHDVPTLMKELFAWLKKAEHEELPCPLRAGIAHYQYATIHPYFDGNGRTTRLLTSGILHECGYGLKGIYSLEEYYAHDLQAYYNALSIGPSHNYYFGRAEADITSWLEYFCTGIAQSFEIVRNKAIKEAITHTRDASTHLQNLSAEQRKVLTLFKKQTTITSEDVRKLFQVSDRTARLWCQRWVKEGFLLTANPSKKKRAYMLAHAS